LKLLERDFTTMRAFSAMHSGRVIKSTGDGLLVFFTSAVQAVEWSLKTQRHFADQAAELTTEEVLRHRVGVHLGDVVVAAGDVMGDGVNIAARVQAAAPPGGICISQDVYSVVKNKMKLDVVRLEPRQLKNINEPVQMYSVLLEPPLQRVARKTAPEAAVATVEEPGAARWKNALAIIFGIAGLGAGGFYLWQANRDHQRELASSQGERESFDAAVRAGTVSGEASARTEIAPPANPSATRAPTIAAAAKPVAAEPFDFAKLTIARKNAAPTADEEQRTLSAAQEALAPLEAWTATALQRYTSNGPLLVVPLRAGFQGTSVFTDSSRHIFFQQGGASRKQSWQDLSAEVRGAIVTALVRSSPVPVPREITRAAEAYAYVHRLPEMADLLLRERGTP
jgi:hypothetical protein